MEEIARWLGGGAERVAPPLAAEVRIEVHGSAHFARTAWFRIWRGNTVLAERRFEPGPAGCDALHAAVGLAIALALKASPAAPPTASGGPPSQERLGDERRRVFAEGFAGLSVVPGASFGVGLGLWQRIGGPFAARLSAFALTGPYGEVIDGQDRFHTWLTVGRLDACAGLTELDAIRLSACVGVAAGGLSARHRITPYVGLAGALELDLALGGRWSLTMSTHLLVPLRRTSFVVRDPAGEVIATRDLASAGALLSLGPSLRF